jgi:GAF domain-containing protein
VGDKIQSIFNPQALVITSFDRVNGLLVFNYELELGKRDVTAPIKLPKRLLKYLDETHRPLVVNQDAEERGAEYDLITIPGTLPPKSFIVIPLISGGQVYGGLSLQQMDRENAYSDSDVRLLSTLTASMSVSLENARLFDETQRLLKETEQRAAELAIINSVQEGLASKLDMQAIYDLVGDKIQSMFQAQSVIIQSFDHEKMLAGVNFAYENGQHFVDDEWLPFSSMTKHLITTRQPVVINENAEEESNKYGLKNIEGTLQPKSLIFVPFGTGTLINGSFSLQNFEREHAFSDSDVRLLQTLAGSMGIALENARLFGETQRLLKETEQRAAELQIINTVQAALAAELNVQGIYDTVGNKIREIFHNADTGIRIYDPKTNLVSFPYTYE